MRTTELTEQPDIENNKKESNDIENNKKESNDIGILSRASSQSDLSMVRTKSIAGTLEYMAPEIIIMLGKRTVHEDGYTAAVDYWSLGVLLYKLLTGDEPYKKMSYSTVQALLPSHLACHSTYSESFAALFGTVNLEVCEGVLTMNSRHLIMSLLAFNAEDRLGSNIADMKAGHNALMTHPFFSGIDWTLLECKQVPPPYIPHDEILETVMMLTINLQRHCVIYYKKLISIIGVKNMTLCL